MAITIRRVQDTYEARVTAPHGEGLFPWQTSVLMERAELVRALAAIGCCTTDIGDALAQRIGNGDRLSLAVVGAPLVGALSLSHDVRQLSVWNCSPQPRMQIIGRP